MKILGWDDWCIYARQDDGVLVYAIMEMDPGWWEAPHGGLCERGNGQDGDQKVNCDGDQDLSCSVDRQWLLDQVKADPGIYPWQKVGNDTDGTPLDWGPDKDDDWAAESARRNLPQPQGDN